MNTKEDQNENNKSLNASLMQTAQFFFKSNEIDQKKLVNPKEEDYSLEFNEFIEISQPLQESIFLSKESEKESKDSQKLQKNKKHFIAQSQKDINKIEHPQKNIVLPHTAQQIQSNSNEQDKRDSKGLSKKNQQQFQSNSSQAKLRNSQMNPKMLNNLDEKNKILKETQFSNVVNDKRRGMSLACQSNYIEMTDQVFWNKINQIVCLKSNQPSELKNNNSESNIQSMQQALYSNQYIQIPLSQSNKPIKTSTDVSNANRNTNGICEPNLKNQNYLQQNQNSAKSIYRIDARVLNQNQSIQLSSYPLESFKSIKSQGQLPLLNSRPKQQKVDYSDQLRSGFFSNSICNTVTEKNRKSIQIDAFDNNFWSSQPSLRSDLQQTINSNSIKVNNFQHKPNSEGQSNFNINYGGSQPYNKALNFQNAFPTMPLHYQNISQQINNHSEYLYIPRSQSQNGILNQFQKFEIPVYSLNSNSNYQSIQEAQINYFSKSQPQDNKFLIHQNPSIKSTLSSPSTAPSSVKEGRHMQKLQFSDFLQTEKDELKYQLDSIELKQSEEFQINGQDQLNNKNAKNQKESHLMNQKSKLKTNQKENLMRKNMNKDEDEKTYIPIREFQESKAAQQNQLKPLKQTKISGNLAYRDNQQVTEELTKLVSSQKTINLKENSHNFDSRQSASAKVKQKQNFEQQKARIKSCQQQIHQNQQEFSFCIEKNHKIKADENIQLGQDEKNILSQIVNLNENLQTAPKIVGNILEKQNTSKKWNQLASLSQTTKENNKFNLKCKQQQNVVKKIFNFDNYQSSQLPTTVPNNSNLEQSWIKDKISHSQMQSSVSSIHLNAQQIIKPNNKHNMNNNNQHQQQKQLVSHLFQGNNTSRENNNFNVS